MIPPLPPGRPGLKFWTAQGLTADAVYIFSCEAGNYALTGSAVSFAPAYRLTGSAATQAITLAADPAAGAGAAVKTFYILNTPAAAPDWFGSLQEGGAAPTVASCTFGATVGTSATAFWRGRIGANLPVGAGQSSASSFVAAATSPTAGTGGTASTAGDSFRSPTTYSGSFAAGDWTLAFGMRTGAANSNGRIRCRVWASVNADGTSARELTPSVRAGSSVVMNSTTATFTSTITWTASAITLVNEYLFFQVEWNVTSASGTTSSSSAIFRQGESSVTSTDFTTGYALTGSDAAFKIGYVADSDAYTLTGSDAALKLGHVVEAGAYTLTGSDADFTTAAGGVTLSVEAGNYTLTGSSAAFATSLAAEAGAYTLTGSDADLNAIGGVVLFCGSGAYTLTGSDATLPSPEPELPPITVTPPSPGGAGVRSGRPLYRRLKLKKKRKREELEELLEFVRQLPPPAPVVEAVSPPRSMGKGLLDGVAVPTVSVIKSAINDVDEDEDEIALLLEVL